MAEQKEESPSLSIVYLPHFGRAYPMRLAAFLVGLSYRDIFTNWQEHGAAKAAGKRRWSGIPEMNLHDKDGNVVLTLGQSNVCLKLIAKLGGKMYPEDAVQSALVDEVMAACEDVFGLITAYFTEQDADKKKEIAAAAMTDDKLPYWMTKFDLRLQENEARGNKSGFFVGDSMTVGDLKTYCMLSAIHGLPDFDVDQMVKANAKLAAFWALMQADGDIAKFNAMFTEQMGKKDVVEHTVKGKNVYIKM